MYFKAARNRAFARINGEEEKVRAILRFFFVFLAYFVFFLEKSDNIWILLLSLLAIMYYSSFKELFFR